MEDDFFDTFSKIPSRTPFQPLFELTKKWKSSYTKTLLTKMSQMIQVHVPNFFYFAEILKMTELRPKNRFFGPEIPKDSKKAKTEEDSYSGICQQKLLTKAMFKPLGYDVHNVHISVHIGD